MCPWNDDGSVPRVLGRGPRQRAQAAAAGTPPAGAASPSPQQQANFQGGKGTRPVGDAVKTPTAFGRGGLPPPAEPSPSPGASRHSHRGAGASAPSFQGWLLREPLLSKATPGCVRPPRCSPGLLLGFRRPRREMVPSSREWLTLRRALSSAKTVSPGFSEFPGLWCNCEFVYGAGLRRGKEGHQGRRVLPAPPPPPQLSPGGLRLGTGPRPEPEAILGSSRVHLPAALVRLPVTPPSILLVCPFGCPFLGTQFTLRAPLGPAATPANPRDTASPSRWLQPMGKQTQDNRCHVLPAGGLGVHRTGGVA